MCLTLSLLMSHICGVSKKFGEWYQKTNKTEDTNKVNLFVSSVLFVLWYHSPNVLDTAYMELIVKPEILTLYIYIYIYGPTFGNAEISLFLFATQCFNTE
jgi:hypothetical protein